MRYKDKNYYPSNYIKEISFVIILLLSLFLIFKNKILGIIGISIFFLLVVYDYKMKKVEEERLNERIKDIGFDLDRILKKNMISNPIPICTIELDGSIFWTNKKFEDMINNSLDEDEKGNNLIGRNIGDILEGFSIRKVLDENKVIESEFSFNGRHYNIIYHFLKSEDKHGKIDYKALIYWLDNTDYEDLKKIYDDNREAVMIIEIDGYEDVLKSAPEENRPMITMDIQKLLSTLESDSEGMMCKMSSGKYLLFLRKAYVEILEKNKFSILDKAREINHGNSLPVSLSIGIGYNGDTISQTGEFASGALDMVLGRGGDQVAIKSNESFEFYGGKSKGFERKTKVKSRLIGLALKELINQSDKIIIMGHKYPDMDAMGAAVGVYDICKSYGKNANIVFDNINEAVEIFAKRVKEDPYYESMYINHEEAINMCDENTLVIVVDTHRPSYTECGKLLSISKRVVVIDHHRRGIEYIKDTVLLFHEIYVSSTCEMVTELIQYTDFDIKINKLTAEGLLGGIYLDTKNFEFKTGVRTFEAASYLRSIGADTLSVKKFFNSYAQDFLVKAQIIQKTEIIDSRICLSYADKELDNINVVIAKAADELLNIKNIEASFVLGKKGDTIFVSARSLGSLNVHILMEKIGGGGHIDIAGAQLTGMSLDEGYEVVKKVIQDYLKENSEDKEI